MFLYGCKVSGPAGPTYLSTEPYRHWKPIQSYQTPSFAMPAHLDNNDPVLVHQKTFWQRRMNKLAYNARYPINSGIITKVSNISSNLSYVPCKSLLEFFESLQIVELEVFPGQVVKETALDMGKFKTLGRSVFRLRAAMEDAGLI